MHILERLEVNASSFKTMKNDYSQLMNEILLCLVEKYGEILGFTEIYLQQWQNESGEHFDQQCYRNKAGDIKRGIYLTSTLVNYKEYEIGISKEYEIAIYEEEIELFLLENGSLKRFLKKRYYENSVDDPCMEREEYDLPPADEISIISLIEWINEHLRMNSSLLESEKKRSSEYLEKLKQVK